MTKLDAVELRRVLISEFGMDVESARFLQAENDDVWRVDECGGRAYLVRVIDSAHRHRSPASGRADFLDTLNPVVEGVPVMRRTGTGSAESSAIDSGVGSYRVEVSQWVRGDDIDPWVPFTAGRAGVVLARFAAASRRLPPRGSAWRSYAPSAVWSRALEEMGGDRRWNSILSRLQPTFVNLEDRLDRDVGLVHGDMHRENFVADATQGTIHIIDFADVGLGSEWYDFASAFSSLARIGDAHVSKSFVTGYLGEARTPGPDVEVISALMTARDVAIATHLATTANDHISLPWVPGRLAELAQNCEDAVKHREHPAVPAYALAVGS